MKHRVQRDRLEPEAVRRRLGRLDLIADLIAQGIRQGLHQSRRRGFSSEFSDFAPYEPGHDARLVDWRVYWRTEELYVRRFEAETSLEVTLLLDASASMAWRWQEQISKLEYAANFLGALAMIHLEHQDRVGMLLHDAGGIRHVPPSSRRRQIDPILASLEALNSTGRARAGHVDSFPAMVNHLARTRHHRGRILVCTDLEEDGEQVREAIESLGASNDQVVVLHLLDRAEIDLPFDQVTHFRDSETGALWPVSLRALRQDHAGNVQRFRDDWRQLCERWGIRYLPLDTATDYVDAGMGLVELLQR